MKLGKRGQRDNPNDLVEQRTLERRLAVCGVLPTGKHNVHQERTRRITVKVSLVTRYTRREHHLKLRTHSMSRGPVRSHLLFSLELTGEECIADEHRVSATRHEEKEQLDRHWVSVGMQRGPFNATLEISRLTRQGQRKERRGGLFQA